MKKIQDIIIIITITKIIIIRNKGIKEMNSGQKNFMEKLKVVIMKIDQKKIMMIQTKKIKLRKKTILKSQDSLILNQITMKEMKT